MQIEMLRPKPFPAIAGFSDKLWLQLSAYDRKQIAGIAGPPEHADGAMSLDPLIVAYPKNTGIQFLTSDPKNSSDVVG